MSKPKNLLVIDDEPSICELIEMHMNEHFDNIVTSLDVVSSEIFLEQIEFSAIILDVKLGDDNGASLVKYLQDRPENPNHDVPIILISGFFNEQFVDKMQDRFYALLNKPFEMEELEEILINLDRKATA